MQASIVAAPGEFRCAEGVAEVMAALRRLRPRRLELVAWSTNGLTVRLTSTYGTGVELPLSVHARSVDSGSVVQVTGPGLPEGRLASTAIRAWCEALEAEIGMADESDQGLWLVPKPR